MSSRPTKPIGREDWARTTKGSDETLASMRSDKFEWLASTCGWARRGDARASEGDAKARESKRARWVRLTMIDDDAMIARALAECRFGGEGCELPPTDDKTGAGAKNGEANGKSVNFFKGILLGVDTRQTGRDEFMRRPREARERRSPSPRPKREKPKPKAAPPPPPPPPPRRRRRRKKIPQAPSLDCWMG